MRQKIKNIIFFSLFLLVLPTVIFGATIQTDKEEVLKARVLEVVSSSSIFIPGMDVETPTQTIKAKIFNKEDVLEEVVFDNDYTQLKEGQKFYVLKTTRVGSESPMYSVSEVNRMPWIIFFTLLFVALTVLLGGMQGVRGLLSLIGSLLLIFYVLIPQILAGHSPFIVSSIVASLIIIVGSYVTHGFNKTTSAAVLGMVITVLLTGALAYFAVHVTNLSGMDTHEASYLAMNTRGTINLQGLLLSGIIIGLLGVLYDSAISQAIIVEELWRANPRLTRGYVFSRSMRIGREHIGALVDTLAIAYVGVALPLLVLFSLPGFGSTIVSINKEMFASEIIRTLIGSIGLILAMPITSVISVWMLHGVKFKGEAGHSHSHVHIHDHS